MKFDNLHRCQVTHHRERKEYGIVRASKFHDFCFDDKPFVRSILINQCQGYFS